MTDRTPFPEVVDSSFFEAARSCHRKVFLEYMEHWKPKSESVHLVAGKAFARGCEVVRKSFYDQGRSAVDSVALGVGALLEAYGSFEWPEDSAKSPTRMAGALEYFFDRYPLGEDNAVPERLPSGSHTIEYSFLEPMDVLHPETGQPVLYSGRFDQIVRYGGGRFGEDDKTTSSLGASWGLQWDLRSQFSAYCWGAARGGRPLDGFMVRGVSILKTKYDTQQAITYRPQWMVDRWYEATCEELGELIAAWKAGGWQGRGRPALSNACNEYGGCGFRQVCQSQDPDPWLETGFERRRWDPVTREETKL